MKLIQMKDTRKRKMPELKTVTEEGCPEDRAYCSDFDPSGKKCKYYKICKPSEALKP